MFGKGVEEDKKKGIEMYGKCGKISKRELGWIRELSNDKFVCGKELNLGCLFLLIEQFSVLWIIVVWNWRFRSMCTRGSIEGEFNSHRVGSGNEELTIYMMSLGDIYMN